MFTGGDCNVDAFWSFVGFGSGEKSADFKGEANEITRNTNF